MTERRSDGVSGNGGSGGNIGGRFGRDRMRFGLNGKEMEWNMVHDMNIRHIRHQIDNLCGGLPPVSVYGSGVAQIIVSSSEFTSLP